MSFPRLIRTHVYHSAIAHHIIDGTVAKQITEPVTVHLELTRLNVQFLNQDHEVKEFAFGHFMHPNLNVVCETRKCAASPHLVMTAAHTQCKLIENVLNVDAAAPPSVLDDPQLTTQRTPPVTNTHSLHSSPSPAPTENMEDCDSDRTVPMFRSLYQPSRIILFVSSYDHMVSYSCHVSLFIHIFNHRYFL